MLTDLFCSMFKILLLRTACCTSVTEEANAGIRKGEYIILFSTMLVKPVVVYSKH